MLTIKKPKPSPRTTKLLYLKNELTAKLTGMLYKEKAKVYGSADIAELTEAGTEVQQVTGKRAEI